MEVAMKLSTAAQLPTPQYRRASDAVEWSLQVTVAPKEHVLVATKDDVREVDGRTEILLALDGQPGSWQPVPDGAKLLVADDDGRVKLEPEDSDYIVQVVSLRDAGSLVNASGRPLRSVVTLPAVRVGVAELRERHAQAVAERSNP